MLHIIRAILQQIIDDIDAGTCRASEEELRVLYEQAMRYRRSTEWLTKEEAARHLGISRATFDRRVAEGTLPHGVKRSGLKELLWSKAMLDGDAFE